MVSIKVRIYSVWWNNMELSCKDLKKLKVGQTSALYMLEAIVLFIFQILFIHVKSNRNDFT